MRIAVAPGELTCTGCGETRAASVRRCPRCTEDEEDGRRGEGPPAVPTVSYLRRDEYVLH